jgi:hypothetical protein
MAEAMPSRLIRRPASHLCVIHLTASRKRSAHNRKGDKFLPFSFRRADTGSSI